MFFRKPALRFIISVYCLPSCVKYEYMPGAGIVLQLVATRGLQPDELDIEDESRVGRDDFTVTART